MEALLLTANLAFAMNVPLGLWRANTKRLSWQWLAAVHMAVPPIMALRLNPGRVIDLRPHSHRRGRLGTDGWRLAWEKSRDQGC
ncbi:MAG: hypothetical protein ABID84_02045 [Chloroflexota bacterium]